MNLNRKQFFATLLGMCGVPVAAKAAKQKVPSDFIEACHDFANHRTTDWTITNTAATGGGAGSTCFSIRYEEERFEFPTNETP